jgi:fido (protein-threonine AMPylation protein)
LKKQYRKGHSPLNPKCLKLYGIRFRLHRWVNPLDDDEKDGLLIPAIATRGELDEFEQQNIEQAVLWSLNRSFKAEAVFTENFIRWLHKRMYNNVWAWSGEFRKSNKTLVWTNGKYPPS